MMSCNKLMSTSNLCEREHRVNMYFELAPFNQPGDFQQIGLVWADQEPAGFHAISSGRLYIQATEKRNQASAFFQYRKCALQDLAAHSIEGHIKILNLFLKA